MKRVTPPMIHGLEVLQKGPSRRSNSTDLRNRHVYWQTADRLVDFGLAIDDRAQGNCSLQITELGRQCLTASGRAKFHQEQRA